MNYQDLLQKYNLQDSTQKLSDKFELIIHPDWEYSSYLSFITDYIELFKTIDFSSSDFVSPIIFTSHPQVLTIGKGRTAKEFNQWENLPIDLHKIHRGGGVTFHSPGQIICYPLINLRKEQISLKEVIVNILGKEFSQYFSDLLVEQNKKVELKIDPLGLWIERNKIGSIGLGIKNDFVIHGLAFNLFPNNILQKISHLSPCGLSLSTYASLSDFISTEELDFKTIAVRLGQKISKHFL